MCNRIAFFKNFLRIIRREVVKHYQRITSIWFRVHRNELCSFHIELLEVQTLKKHCNHKYCRFDEKEHARIGEGYKHSLIFSYHIPKIVSPHVSTSGGGQDN